MCDSDGHIMMLFWFYVVRYMMMCIIPRVNVYVFSVIVWRCLAIFGYIWLFSFTTWCVRSVDSPSVGHAWLTNAEELRLELLHLEWLKSASI